jgi:hypothetical protein
MKMEMVYHLKWKCIIWACCNLKQWFDASFSESMKEKQFGKFIFRHSKHISRLVQVAKNICRIGKNCFRNIKYTCRIVEELKTYVPELMIISDPIYI